MIRIIGTALSVLGLVLITALGASAADGESGATYPSQCTVGTDTRPAVHWRANRTVEVTPPGYGSGSTLFFYGGSAYMVRTTGGYMTGGDWVVYTLNGDVDRPQTYDACVEP